MKRADAVLDGVEVNKIRMIRQGSWMYPTKRCLSVHSITFDWNATKVQVVLNKAKNTKIVKQNRQIRH